MQIMLQARFATEFAAFLVAAAGLAVVSFGRSLAVQSIHARWLWRGGFLLEAMAAALTGTLIGGQASGVSFPVVLFLRTTGLLLLAIGSVRDRQAAPWQGEESARVLWWFGLAAVAMNVAFSLIGTPPLDPIIALDIADIAIALTLARVGRRAVAARVATAAAAALLAMVLVLSVALSTIIESTLRAQAFQRLQVASVTRSAAILSLTTHNLRDLSYLFAQLVESYVKIRCPTASGMAQVSCIQAAVTAYSSQYFPSEGAIWLSSSGHVLAASPSLVSHSGESAVRALGSGLVVKDSIDNRARVAAVEVAAGKAWAVASAPAITTANKGPAKLTGVVILVVPLDSSYLSQGRSVDPTVSFSLASPQILASSSGSNPPPGTILHLAHEALANARAAFSVKGQFYISVQPLPGPRGLSQVALIASEPSSVVLIPEESLFKTLFLVGLAGTVLALLLASLVGERVGTGLRRLTAAAQAIRQGQGGVRARVESYDEVGALGEAFDAMATSIEEKTAALRGAAHAEAMLRQRLEAVVGGIEEALVAVDQHGLITDFNPAAEALFGVSASLVTGRPLNLAVTLISATGEPFQQIALPPNGASEGQAKISLPQGEEFPVAYVAGSLGSSETQAEGAVYLFRDLRPEHALEQMKTEFLSRISHELRTPLTGIIGFSDLLARREVEPARAQAWHENILEQAKRIGRTVELLEFVATTGAGRVVLHPAALDVPWLLGDMALRWNRRTGGLPQVVSEPHSNLPQIFGDVRWLTLALDELVDNAIKFSEQATVVTLGASIDQDGTNVLISVADTGKGMTRSEQEAAFGEFVQGDSSDTRSYGGLGLGLVLVRRVVEAHEGWVTCKSGQGRGSEMSIHLPILGMPRRRNVIA